MTTEGEMTMREAYVWVEALWRAAGELRQAALPYADRDERLRAALDRLSEVLDGRR